VETFTAIMHALTALLTVVSPIVLSVLAKLWHRDNVTDDRVDLLWRSFIIRGEAEMVIRQLATQNGEAVRPYTIRPDTRAAYEPIAPALRELRRSNIGLSDERFAEMVAKKYDAWLVKHICIPLGISQGACQAMALSVANEPPPSQEVTPLTAHSGVVQPEKEGASK
jgi:hypothetical protein